MTSLRPFLLRLGLSQYIDKFINEGFEAWETVLDITESDLDALGVKLGHRRILQREIRNARGQTADQIDSPNSPLGSHQFLDSQCRQDEGYRDGRPGGEPRTKRKYRRHPKPDKNAPERPPSAYVIFSNRIREELRPLSLSFTEIAKRVGEKWQILSPEDKAPFGTQASTAKDRYNTEMGEYKLTNMHSEYNEYLAEFKAKNSLSKDEKRPRLQSDEDIQDSISTPSVFDGSDFLLGNSDAIHRRVDSMNSSGHFSTTSAPTSPVSATARPSALRGAPAPIHAMRNSSPSSTSPSSPSIHSNPSPNLSTLPCTRPSVKPYSAASETHHYSLRDLQRKPSDSIPARNGSSNAKPVNSVSLHGRPSLVGIQPLSASGRLLSSADYNASDSSKSSTSSKVSSGSTIASSVYGSRTSEERVPQITLPPLSSVGFKSNGRPPVSERTLRSTVAQNPGSTASLSGPQMSSLSPFDLTASSGMKFGSLQLPIPYNISFGQQPLPRPENIGEAADLCDVQDIPQERTSLNDLTLQQSNGSEVRPRENTDGFAHAPRSRPILPSIRHTIPQNTTSDHLQRSSTDPLFVLAEAAGAKEGFRQKS